MKRRAEAAEESADAAARASCARRLRMKAEASEAQLKKRLADLADSVDDGAVAVLRERLPPVHAEVAKKQSLLSAKRTRGCRACYRPISCLSGARAGLRRAEVPELRVQRLRGARAKPDACELEVSRKVASLRGTRPCSRRPRVAVAECAYAETPLESRASSSPRQAS